MRALILWDDAEQAELIALYLDVDEDSAVVTCDADEFTRVAESDDTFDVVLLPTAWPDHDTAFARFQSVHELLPECPVVGACATGDVFRLATFITSGMRSYLLKDAGGDFVFLLSSTLRSTVDAVRAERERAAAAKMRSEIESVRRFQESVIPKTLPTSRGFTLEGRYEPSQIRTQGGRPVALAGGDYYDAICIDDRTLILLTGDAAGHGMRACMSIMAMYTLIHMLAEKSMRRPHKFLEEVNQRFCEHAVFQDGTMFTFFAGVLRTDRRELTWASAGHPLPLLQRSPNEVEPLGELNVTGPPLGFDERYRYDVATSTLPAESRLLIFTDGLTEAHPEGDVSRQFGEAGVRKTLARTWGTTPAATLDALLADSHAWTEGSGRHDDTSLLLLDHD